MVYTISSKEKSGRHIMAKKSLGQNFLKSKWPARDLARASNIAKEDAVLEIGPGKGMLTQELLSIGANIIAVEIDEQLVEYLKQKFAKEIATKQLTVFHSDIRKISRVPLDILAKHKDYNVVANIPYYITGEIIRMFLTARNQPKTMALLVQKEVAERIAKPKNQKESILSLSVKAYGTPKYIKTVGASEFTPKPKVDSAILIIENISRDFFKKTPKISEENFFKVVKTGFSSKRKLLANNLSAFVDKDKERLKHVFEKCSIMERARAEDVSLEKWRCLTKAI